MLATKCPPRETLVGFVTGQLEVGEIESVADHLEACEECESTVALFDHESDTFIGGLGLPDEKAEFADEPEFQHAVDAANALAEQLVQERTGNAQ